MVIPAQLRAVITDLDGTLYSQGPVRRYVAIQLLRYAMLHPLNAWKTIGALSAYRRAQEELRAGGQASRQAAYAAQQSGYAEEFVNQCVERWMNTVPLASLEKARRPGVLPFLDWARGRGIHLAVVSDYDAQGKLRALGLDGYFPVVVCARDEEVGQFKPNPLALQVAARRLGVKPEEALYIGDRLEVDGAAAVAAGVPGIIIADKTGRTLPGVAGIGTWFELRSLIEARVH